MQGNLILNADPTANLGAATKQYVDNSIKLKQVLNEVTFNGAGQVFQLQFVEEYTDASIIFIYFTGSGQGNIYLGKYPNGSNEYISFYVNEKYNCMSYVLVNMGNKVFAPNKTSQRGDKGVYYAAVGIDLKSTVYVFLNGANSVTISAFAIM